jgi:hypothetical protein
VLYMFVRHAVKDFSKWKSAYEADQIARQAAGLRQLHLWRNADESHEVVLLFELSDPAKAKAFAASMELKDRMAASGVAGRPEIVFLSET